MADTEQQPIIIKKVVKGGHGHHGGAWKVAYADFVTAMMAFFMLLWLLNVTTDEQKSGIADYFSPASVSQSSSGSGGILGGETMAADGAMISQNGVPTVVMSIGPGDQEVDDQIEPAPELSDQELEAETARREQEKFDAAVEALNKAVSQSPDLADLSHNLLIDNTPEGLRIQLIDNEGRSMFQSGRAELPDRTRALLEKIAKVVQRLPNKIRIAGHTDATPYHHDAGYGNWELSADRANASRRALLLAGLSPDRIDQVTGKAAQDPLLPDDPTAPSNRRISIILLREAKLPPAYPTEAEKPPAIPTEAKATSPRAGTAAGNTPG